MEDQNTTKKYPYNAKDIIISLLKSAGYICSWLLISILVEIIVLSIVIASNGGASYDDVLKLVYSKSVELTLVANLLTIIIFSLFYKIRHCSVQGKMNILPVPKNILISSLLFGISAQIVIILILSLFPIPESWLQIQEDTYAEINQNPFLFVNILTVVFAAPVTEEIVFRGLVLNRLRRAMPEWVAIVLASLAFALVHTGFYAKTYAFIVGALMGFLFVKFDSVLPTILFHIGFNGMSMLLQGVYSTLLLILIIIACLALFIYETFSIAKTPRIVRTANPEQADNDFNNNNL